MRPAHLDLLLSPINKLKGVGPKLENIINKLGIKLNVHFLWHFPYRIIEKKYYENIHDAPINQLVTLKIEVIKHYPSKFRRQPYRVSCLANETPIDIVYFNARHPVVRSVLPVKNIKMISGKLEFFKNKFQITHPSSIENISDIQLLREKEPVYSLTAGLNMKSFIKLSNQVLQSVPDLDEWINKTLIKKYEFTSWKDAVEKLVENNYIKSAHDVSLGGIITGISKMCFKGNMGIELKKPKSLLSEFEYFFSEDQGRYIIEITKLDIKKVTNILEKNAVHYDEIGILKGKSICFDEKTIVPIDELNSYNNNWLSDYMS